MEDLTDIADSLIPKSDQLNAEHFLTGPRVYTIERVVRGASDEQPVQVLLRESPGKPWRACKSMRRVLALLWGRDPREWVGRRIELYRDPAVRFGGMDTGGIRIKAMSDIGPKYREVALTVTRGKRALYRVEPLTVAAPAEVLGMEATLEQAGLTVEAWDRWAVAQGRTPHDAMAPKQRQAAAKWLAGGGAEEVRPFAVVEGGEA